MRQTTRLGSLLSLCAFLPLAPVLAGNGNGEPATTSLERALGTIDANEIHADLAFLASDAMKGRDTPSPEQRIAARFIGARLARLGFVPGAQDGWYWSYEMPTVAIDGAASSLKLQSGAGVAEFALGTDYAFSTRAISDMDVQADSIVYGGTFSEEEREGLEFEDSWLLVRRSEMESREIFSLARKGKAAGVLVIPGGDWTAAKTQEELASKGAALTLGKVTRGRSNRKSLPYLYLSESAGERLFELGGVADPLVGAVLPVGCTETRVRKTESTVGLENVVGIWPGNDPKLKNELLIISAHYDHVGVDSNTGEVYNGADDNGSGTSAVLAVAEALAEYGPMRRSVMLMWVSGEEKGLLGSGAWTKNPYLPLDLKPVLDLNIDMVGRNAPRSLLITPTKDHDAYNGLTRLAESLREREGFDKLGSADAYWSRSDHANFSRNLEIPVAFLFADVHEDYHKVTDTVDKIDFDKIRRVARLVVRMLDGLQTDTLALN